MLLGDQSPYSYKSNNVFSDNDVHSQIEEKLKVAQNKVELEVMKRKR
jgi:hypothetical protein